MASNVKQKTEQILSAAFATPIRLVDRPEKLTSSERCSVFRWRVQDAAGDVPAQVVVKQSAVQADSGDDPKSPAAGPALAALNEWAGLEFTNRAFQGSRYRRCVPQLYGGDQQSGLVVLEHLGAGRRLDEYLLGDDPAAAEQALAELFGVVGTLHAVSFGRKSEYEQIRMALGPVRRRNVNQRIAATVEKAGAVCALLGLTPTPGFYEELAAAVRSAWEPTTFMAYKHRDVCEDNCLRTDDGWKLFDFESGEFGNALWDGLCPRLLFPTGWCVGRIPCAVLTRVEAAYREAFGAGCPEAAQDALFYPAVAETCAYWAVTTLFGSLPAALENDFANAVTPSGKHYPVTKRQCVLARLDIAAETTAEYGHFEAVGTMARDAATKLREMWRSPLYELPFYPAFV